VTVFKDMHETRVIDSQWDYQQLLRMLSEAIARGYVEQVPVMNLAHMNRHRLGSG
jgi:hypothetical protein